MKFNKLKIGFNDVEKVAEGLVNKQKHGDKSRNAKYQIVKDLVKHKLKDSVKCIKKAKEDLKKSNNYIQPNAIQYLLKKGDFSITDS